MYWKDEGYLLSKTSFNENSIIIEAFTMNHGKYSGVVYGGSSRKQKKNFQIGNKILLNWRSKNENKMGYFNIELIDPIAPLFFDNKKKAICILSATSILKTLLPERQINKKIYFSFDRLIEQLNQENWIKLYIFWELSLIKELGFDSNFFKEKNIDNHIEIDNKKLAIPDLIIQKDNNSFTNFEIQKALIFNKFLIMEYFILPNRLRLPFSRTILEKYYN
jgi:DNA repair protein RecO (recombination protein O)